VAQVTRYHGVLFAAAIFPRAIHRLLPPAPIGRRERGSWSRPKNLIFRYPGPIFPVKTIRHANPHRSSGEEEKSYKGESRALGTPAMHRRDVRHKVNATSGYLPLLARCRTHFKSYTSCSFLFLFSTCSAMAPLVGVPCGAAC
jgi:hypothetical protein